MSCQVKPTKLGCRIRMPRIGFGTWQMYDANATELALENALEIGYRHLDTAFIYRNEISIGKVLKKWLAKGNRREELFITSKLPPYGLRRCEVNIYLNKSLEMLQTDYLDLYLIHHPFGFFPPRTMKMDPNRKGNLEWSKEGNEKIRWDYCTNHVEVWKGMEQAVREKRVKHIGLSNFNIKQMEKLFTNCKIRPSCLQVEMHAFLQEKLLSCYCRCNDMELVAYSPFGSNGNAVSKQHKSALKHPLIVKCAKELSCTPAQLILAYLIHLGAIPIPMAKSRNFMKENFAAQFIELTPKHMRELGCLHLGEEGRIFHFREWEGVLNHPEYPWKIPECFRKKLHAKIKKAKRCNTCKK
ncbi:alcohol dehydrogenase [NADP(+)]-like [Ctenocephalides felis]|uniref:alcohol dehydrogenase [NADP(+)]-like n=1 Tax=Ctenocephalides felis TaxID=7515 RepID=UPI000E6E49BE|nr:alcohol dehydrogenase [NADP(+)]-like [Ctenocephalides felis]